MMESRNSNIYICNDDTVKLGALSVTDDLMLIAFFNKDGVFDHKKVISFEERARHWGKDLFLYYKENSKRSNRILIQGHSFKSFFQNLFTFYLFISVRLTAYLVLTVPSVLSDTDWIHGFDNINDLFFYFNEVFPQAVNPEYNICYNHNLNLE